MGLTPIQNKLWVYACNDEGDESDRENTTRCKKTFTQNVLKNMTLAHDVLIKDRIFQQKIHQQKNTPTKNNVRNLK